MMRRIVLLVTVVAMMVAMLAMSVAPAFATHNPVQRPFDTFTVLCPNFPTGHGAFTQTLPERALHGSLISNAQVNEHTGSQCVILRG